MSWLVSVVLAGMMFASTDSNLPIQTNRNYIETNKTQIVRLDETERFEQTYPLNANGKVSLSNINGSITIEAWDRNEVKVVAVKTADTREHLSQIDINIDSRPDYLRIETDIDSVRRRNNGNNKDYGKIEVTYQLTVPRGAVLDEIEAVNGTVIVSNMVNFTKISAVNGEVRATNLRGTANLSTVNGTVEADFSTLQTGSQISLSTVNGRANLIIPSNAEATIKADSLNGNIVTDFGLPVRKGQYVGRNLYGRVGNGDVKIRLNSVNGDLTVRRKQDGKTINPSTNLLSPGAANEMDDDDNSEAEVEAKIKNKAKVARTRPGAVYVPRGVVVNIPEINREVQKEMAKAQQEIARSQRELAKTQININTEEINAQVRAEMAKQKEVFARLNDGSWFAGSPAIEKKSDSYQVKGTPKVTIDAKDCAVTIRGWDKQEVQYSLTRFSRINTPGSPLEAKVEHSDSAVSIKVAGNNFQAPNGTMVRGLSRMKIEVFVPKKSNLRIHTNGEIRLENVSGEIDLQGDSEAVNVRDSDGKLNIVTADGRVRVIGFRGDLDAQTQDGTMNLEGVFQNFNAKTVDGTIVLTLPSDANALFDANTEIQNDGLNLIQESGNSNIWRLGKGGNIYRFTAAEGKVIVRNASAMNTIWQ